MQQQPEGFKGVKQTIQPEKSKGVKQTIVEIIKKTMNDESPHFRKMLVQKFVTIFGNKDLMKQIGSSCEELRMWLCGNYPVEAVEIEIGLWKSRPGNTDFDKKKRDDEKQKLLTAIFSLPRSRDRVRLREMLGQSGAAREGQDVFWMSKRIQQNKENKKKLAVRLGKPENTSFQQLVAAVPDRSHIQQLKKNVQGLTKNAEAVKEAVQKKIRELEQQKMTLRVEQKKITQQRLERDRMIENEVLERIRHGLSIPQDQDPIQFEEKYRKQVGKKMDDLILGSTALFEEAEEQIRRLKKIETEKNEQIQKLGKERQQTDTRLKAACQQRLVAAEKQRQKKIRQELEIPEQEDLIPYMKNFMKEIRQGLEKIDTAKNEQIQKLGKEHQATIQKIRRQTRQCQQKRQELEGEVAVQRRAKAELESHIRSLRESGRQIIPQQRTRLLEEHRLTIQRLQASQKERAGLDQKIKELEQELRTRTAARHLSQEPDAHAGADPVTRKQYIDEYAPAIQA
ncbi:hypothetical protein EBZ80_16365 [bacterium]|nr:hypothetical protein [bacterium]